MVLIQNRATGEVLWNCVCNVWRVRIRIVPSMVPSMVPLIVLASA